VTDSSPRRSTQNPQNAQSSQNKIVSANSANSALTVVVPGDLETRTGGYGYDRRIIAGLRALEWRVEVAQLADGFPFPSTAARADAERALAAIPAGRRVLVDGLALGALPDEAARHAARLAIVALVHHPLAAETGLDPAVAAALEESERRALASARSVVVTSRGTAAALARYGVAADRIGVVEPGTDPAPLARGSQSAIINQQSAISLLCVATLTPRKGHELLLRALASVPARDWRLTCAGGFDRDPATAERVRALVRELELEDHVMLYEGYGMAVAEALARGLPVVSTATGAIAQLVGECAGIVVPPGDRIAFSAALARVLGDASLRDRLAAGARAVRDHLPTWDAAAAAMAQALERIRG
jgi:glycosyltransferase involved in cell wall biosynthesis